LRSAKLRYVQSLAALSPFEPCCERGDGFTTMNDIAYPFLFAWVIGTILSVTGLVNIAGHRGLREAYARWEFPPRFYLVVGVLELTAAALLAMPELRGWGIGLTGFIMFGAVVTLFNHRHYLLAVPGMMLMVGLVPVSLAVPHETHQVHYANTLPAK
jgi:DoxX-like family